MLWFKSDLGSFYFLDLRSILQFTAWLQQRDHILRGNQGPKIYLSLMIN